MYGLHSEQVWTGPGPGQAGLHVLQEEGQGFGSHVTHHITPLPPWQKDMTQNIILFDWKHYLLAYYAGVKQ